MKTLLIVESPAKAKTIEKLLGPGYIVKSSFGHIRDLDKKDFGVDIENNFKPNYKLVPTRSKQIKELIDTSKAVDRVLLAADEDREGEAIAWHVSVILKMSVSENNRICFHEITKKALENAVANPRKIDMAMVNSQQSRRILDRIVGFSLSPLLWKYIAPNLSGGRVQSVCLKLIIEKEESIDKFSDAQFYKVKGYFQHQLVGMLNTKFEKKDLMINFLNHCKTAQFQIKSIEKNVSERNPPPSYITSSIQQDAGLRFGMSSKKIMSTLQKLYENGLITYHRTDNVNLSAEFIQKISDYVTEKYGSQYFKKHVYKSKVKCAQEAHEAIRPTNINTKSLDKDDYDAYEQKLYQLIWKRTIASQMSKAIYDVYKIYISISDCPHMFVISFEKLVFDGYKKIYEDFVSKKNNDDEQDEATLIEDESILEKIKEKATIKYKKIEALEKFSQPPSRYSESTLIKKMEKLGIGRPSTYSNIINTLIERNYMKIENIEGKKQRIYNYILEKQEVKEEEGTVSVGSEKKKLLPSQLGKNTCNFLNEHFVDLMDYKFTSVLEEKLDDVANNKVIWNHLLKDFYGEFYPIVDKLKKVKKNENDEDNLLNKYKNNEKRHLGINKKNQHVYAYEGKFGPVLQFIERDDPEKISYQSLEKFDVKKVTLEDIQDVIVYPLELGNHENKQVFLKKGKYGIYLEHNKTNYKLLETYQDKEVLTLEEAVDCISNSKKKSANLHEFDDYIVKEGPYGPYILYKKKFYKIPKTMDIEKMTKENCVSIVNQTGSSSSSSNSKSTTKSSSGASKKYTKK